MREEERERSSEGERGREGVAKEMRSFGDLPVLWPESMAAIPHRCGFRELMRGEINPFLLLQLAQSDKFFFFF